MSMQSTYEQELAKQQQMLRANASPQYLNAAASGQYGFNGGYAGPGSGSMSMTVNNPFPFPAYPGTAAATSGKASGKATATGGMGGNADAEAASKYLNRVLSGKELPYDQATQANMLSQQSGMNASAEAARNAMMTDGALAGGAGMNDPSLQGARMNSMARRQSDNANSANAIAQNANKANFGAKLSAAGTLADFGLAEEDRRLRAQQASMQMLQGMSTPFPTANSGSFIDGSFNQTQAPAQQQQAVNPYTYASANAYTPYRRYVNPNPKPEDNLLSPYPTTRL